MPEDGQQADLTQVAEGSPLVRLLETKARVKMLDIMLRHSYASLTEGEIAERAGLNQSTVNRNIDVFQDLGIVESEDSWPAEHRINLESSVVKAFQEAQMELLEHSQRLTEDDVQRREAQNEWLPIEELEDRDLRIVISELQDRLSIPSDQIHHDDNDGVPRSFGPTASPTATQA